MNSSWTPCPLPRYYLPANQEFVPIHTGTGPRAVSDQYLSRSRISFLSLSIEMENLKALLSSLLGNHLDRVTIIYNLKKLKVDFDDEAPFVVLKYKLQLLIIENICKEIHQDQNVYFARLKQETEKLLEFHHQKLDKRMFKCCLVGCLYKCNRHRNYIRHVKHAHSRESNLVCQFGMVCTRTFSSMDLLQQHIDHVHCGPRRSGTEAAPVEIACKCSIVKCAGAQFSNITNLMLHLRNIHAKVGELVGCIFENCDKKFSNANSLRNHFFQKHLKPNLCRLKAVHHIHRDNARCEVLSIPNLLELENDQVEDDELEKHPVEDNELENDQVEDESDTEDDLEQDLDDYFLMAYGDFLNRLANFHFIPQSTIKIIGDEYLKHYTKSNEAKAKVLKQSLEKIPGISEADIQRVLDDVQNQDSFHTAQTKLDSEYKRTLFIRDKFTYVAPQEILLNSKEVKEEKAPKAVIHYVPIIETFKNLVQDPTFYDVVERNIITNDSESSLRDVKDGELYKNNPYFKLNPDSYTMMIYSDAIELVNPLGAGRGKHKVIQIFFSLCEIPKYQRSKIDRIQLVAVFKERLVKQFGFKKIYQQLVEDLKVLEAGVTVYYPVQRIVKCGVLIHPADNLEAHGVAGFSQSFSSKDICRFCHLQHSDLMENIHDYGPEPHAKWTVDEYDRAAIAAENKKKTLEREEFEQISDSSEDESGESDAGEENDEDNCDDTIKLFGVKHICPLNSLQAFHCTTGFPPDILHDLFEGVICQDLLGIIRILSLKKWFSIEEYNKSLESLSFKSYEATDRPQSVPLNRKAKKLIGKACSIWVHMRNFPFVIRKFVKDREDPILMLGLVLHEMTERLTASEFKDYEIHVLEEIIVHYLDERKKVFDDYPNLIGTPKPKTHYLSHYPQAIRLYGPPLSYWTARYESRHRIAKNTSESAKNFRNISLTVSTRQQMRQSSVYYHGMFATSDLIINDKTTFKSSMKGITDFEKSILPYMSDEDFLCSEIEIKSQMYRSGQLVVLEMYGPDEMKVGLIVSILVKEKSVFFVTKQYVATRSYLQYFQAKSDDPTMSLSDFSKIVEYKPQINHGTTTELFFCLHHHISYSYP